MSGSAVDVERMRALRDEGWSVRAIAREVGTSKSTVARLLKPVEPAPASESKPVSEPERIFRTVRVDAPWPNDRERVELFEAVRWGQPALVDRPGRFFCRSCQRLLDDAEALEFGNGHPGTPGSGVHSWKVAPDATGFAREVPR